MRRFAMDSAVLLGVLVLMLPSGTDAQKKAGPKRATLFMDAGAQPRLQAHTVRDTIEALLRQRTEVRFVPLAELLEDPRLARKGIKEAEALAEKGKAQLGNLEVEEGVASLEKALELREKHFHVLSLNAEELEKHAMLMSDLAMGYYMFGDEEKVRQSLLQAFVFNPKQDFDAKRFPPQMKQIFDETRWLAEEMGTGDIYVETVPKGAEVRANGNFIGYSPTVARGLATGNNLVTVSALGYATRTQRVPVQGGGKSSQVTIELMPLDDNPMELLRTGVLAASAGETLGTLAQFATSYKTPVILLASVGGRDDMVVITLFAYDDAKKALVGKVSGTISAVDPEPECKQLVENLLAALAPPVASTQATTPEPDGEPWFSRFRGSPWFWPVVGVAAAAVIAGTAVGIYYGTREGDDWDRRQTVIILPAAAPGYGP